MKMETRYGLPWPRPTIQLDAGLYHIPHPLLLGHRHLSLSLQLLVSVRDLSFIFSSSGRACALVLLVPDTAAVDLSPSRLRQQ